MVAEPGLLPQAGITHLNGTDHLSLTLPINAEITPSDLKFTVLRSTDLLTWSTDHLAVGSDGFDEILCVERWLFRSTLPFGSLPAEFLRIQITEAGP